MPEITFIIFASLIGLLLWKTSRIKDNFQFKFSVFALGGALGAIIYFIIPDPFFILVRKPELRTFLIQDVFVTAMFYTCLVHLSWDVLLRTKTKMSDASKNLIATFSFMGSLIFFAIVEVAEVLPFSLNLSNWF